MTDGSSLQISLLPQRGLSKFRINSGSSKYHLKECPSSTPCTRSSPKHNSDFMAPKWKYDENKNSGPLSFTASDVLIPSSDLLPQGSSIITLSFILTSNVLIWVLYLTFLYLSKSMVFMVFHLCSATKDTERNWVILLWDVFVFIRE